MAELKRFFKNRSFPRSVSGRQQAATHLKRAKLHIEQLEPRMLMDGAGFIHTDPPEDPDTIVGVAGIVANDDHRETRRGTIQLRLDPLRNDALPEGSENLHIKSVSETKLGHTVTISDDGQRLIYSAGEGGLQAGDTFYYVVESDDGKLGKANVNLSLEKEFRRAGGGGGSTPRSIGDQFTFFEDVNEQQLNVLRNDQEFRDGEIVAVSFVRSSYNGPLNEAPPNGSIRIGEGGKSLSYQPSQGFTGIEYYTYTVRNEEGDDATASVRITIDKPVGVRNEGGWGYRNYFDYNTGNHLSEALFWNKSLTPDVPYVEKIDAPSYVGEISLSDNSKNLAYKPDPKFIGSFAVSYTVRYGSEDYQIATGTLVYRVYNRFLVIDNWYNVEPNSLETQFHVLENDPAFKIRDYHYRREPVELKVTGTSSDNQHGQLRIADDGKSIFYQPATGFFGDETFTYEVLASNGVRDSATVTVHVADPIADPSGVDRYTNEAELQQFLIDKAVAQYSRQFGLHETRYATLPEGAYNPFVIYDTFSAGNALVLLAAEADHSETNTQVESVDEADIVETDGHFVYTFTNGTLVIVDVSDPTTAHPVSFTEFDGKFDLMYLQGERMTLLRNGSQHTGGAEVLVLDISDRSAPTTIERTEIDGYIADSRAIGDRVHLVVKRSFLAPELGGEWIVEPIPPSESSTKQTPISDVDSASIFIDYAYHSVDRGEPGVWRNETLDEYVDRVRDSLIENGLPSFQSYDASGELIRSGLLTEATSVHKPVAGSDLLVSLLTIDAGDDAVGPLAAATSFVADSNTDVFVSANSAYVFAFDPQAGISNVYKMNFEDDGSLPIVASGVVGGRLINQFSADEHDGRLRIATTETRNTTIGSSWGRRRVQQRLFNNVLVLEQQGNKLTIVGEVTNLAPTETIHSVRFMGERAFVVTFRRVDPLFALDMSDPTNPTVEGALKIPGFSNYLHPVGNDYLIGIGRDASEITGRLGPLQITLFNVNDLSDPHVADQLTFDGALSVNSEAWLDHHAVSFFSNSGVLTIPITWSEQVELESEGVRRNQTINRSAIWTFKVDIENADGPSIEATGSVEHEAASYGHRLPFGDVITTSWWGGWTFDPGSPARRALRVGESLITVSNEYVKINDLHDPSIELAEVFLGQLSQNDTLTIEEDSGINVLDVRANDLSDPGNEAPLIVGITQPKQGGLVTISDDGETLFFTPEQDFFGQVTFTYTTHDEVRGEETATVSLRVENIPDTPTAVDDTFSVEINSDSIVLDVLENDLNPDAQSASLTSIYSPLTLRNSFICDCAMTTPIVHTSFQALRLIELGKTSQQGSVELDDWGRLIYTPAAGFEGFETFTYTIITSYGVTDVGTVTVQVGSPVLLLTQEFLRRLTEGFKSSFFDELQMIEDTSRNEIVLSEVFDHWQQPALLENLEELWSSDKESLATDQDISYSETVALKLRDGFFSEFMQTFLS